MVAATGVNARRAASADLPMSVIDEVCKKVIKLHSNDRDLASSRYYIDVPYRFAGERGVRRFPPKGVSLYTFDEAVHILAVFNKRWLRKGTFPPPEMEPRAVKAKKRKDISDREFTLRDLLFQEHIDALISRAPSEEETGEAEV